MVEPEEVDLAKALAMLSKLLARTAADIMIELDNPERTHELAGALEQTAQLLRQRAMDTPPKIIDAPIVSGPAVSKKHPPGAAMVGPRASRGPTRPSVDKSGC